MSKPVNDFEPEAVSTGLPHSREAEEAVIGSILINPYLLDELADLQPEDFYIHRLRFIQQAYLRLREKKQDLDSLTVCEELEDMGRLDEIGGPAYLTALLNCVPTTLHVESYALIVQSAAMRRRLLVAANQIATLAYDESTPAEEVAELAAAAVRNAVESFSEEASHSFAEVALEL